MMKIKFKDLDVWLKIPIISAWIVGIIYAGALLVGFLIGLSA